MSKLEISAIFLCSSPSLYPSLVVKSVFPLSITRDTHIIIDSTHRGNVLFIWEKLGILMICFTSGKCETSESIAKILRVFFEEFFFLAFPEWGFVVKHESLEWFNAWMMILENVCHHVCFKGAHTVLISWKSPQFWTWALSYYCDMTLPQEF